MGGYGWGGGRGVGRGRLGRGQVGVGGGQQEAGQEVAPQQPDHRRQPARQHRAPRDHGGRALSYSEVVCRHLL